jgi:N-acetylglucosaminyl-diphospho-decaprenol L-rhamnosyltransferase
MMTPKPDMKPELSIVILNWNTRELLAQCIDAIVRHIGNTSYEVVVVDNASTDGSQDMLATRFSWVRLIQNTQNVGFARANNRGMRECCGANMLLLNTDAFVRAGSLQAMMQVLHTQPHAGIVGAHLLNADGSFQASHTPFPSLPQEFMILSGLGRALLGPHYPSRGAEENMGPQKVDYVEGAALLVRREAFEKAGGLDEDFFMYAEEVDWCYAMKKAGWQVWYAPEAKITHLGGASSKNRKTAREADLYRSRVRFFRKHHGVVPAALLKSLIIASVVAKHLWHGVLRATTGGKHGRPVTTLQQIRGL